MITVSSSTPFCVYVAIDVAKLKHDVFIKLPDGKTKTLKISNNASDFDKFCQYLTSLKHPCRVALEPTADYHRLIAWRLIQHGCEVRLASSIACARTREAIFNPRDKNDDRRTQLLHSLKNHYIALYFPEIEKYLLSNRAL